jgi:hypothetical protein
MRLRTSTATRHQLFQRAGRFRRRDVLTHSLAFLFSTSAICIGLDKFLQVDTANRNIACVRTRDSPIKKEIASSHSHLRHRARPTPNELLATPIHLRCDGLTVVEWRPTVRWRRLTSPRPESIAVIDDLCVNSLEKYPKYLYDRFGWMRDNGSSVDGVSVSLLPANELVEGRSPRAMNDFLFRFKGLQTCCNWAMYVSSISSLFIRNDPLLERGGKPIAYRHFAKIFVHEMAHVMNDRYGYKPNYFPGDTKRDEQLAEEFSGAMGYEFETESPAQDIADKE